MNAYNTPTHPEHTRVMDARDRQASLCSRCWLRESFERHGRPEPDRGGTIVMSYVVIALLSAIVGVALREVLAWIF